MESLTRGMSVHTLDDRVIGSVSAVNPCCFQFERSTGGVEESVGATGIFDVQTGVVTLICYEAESHRYACPIHPPVMRRSGSFTWPPALRNRSARPVGTHSDTIAHRLG